MESSVKNMVLTLLAITFVSAAAVGTIYEITQEPIAAAKSAKIGSAVALVVPPFDNNPDETKTIDSLDGKTVTVYTALSGQDTVGYAIETFSNSGFGGEIRLMVGFLPDGTIHRVETLSHNETPGLGDKIDRSKSDFSVQFEGKNPRTFRLAVRKDGGDVDAITASTISSRAYAEALTRAYHVFESIHQTGTSHE